MGNTVDKISIKAETLNYCRIILLMVDVGTETLLHLFYSCVPKENVNGYFATKKLDIKHGKKKKVFDKIQRNKLTCPHPNPDEFDISLLIKLLTHFELSPVKLDDLQKIRNDIVGHIPRAELTNDDFEKLWDDVTNILLNIAKSVSGEEEEKTKLKINELQKKELDVSDRDKKIIKAFEVWYQEEITLVQKNIDNLKVAVNEKADKNRESIESLAEKVTLLSTTLITMKNDIQELKKVLYNLVGESQHPANRQHIPHGYEAESSIAHKKDILKMLRRDLIIYYRKELNKLQLSPLLEEEWYAENFFDAYVKPNITILSQKMSKSVTLHDIFSCQKICISSPSGCGKTSFAKYLTLVWCQAKKKKESNTKKIIKEDVKEMKIFKFLFFVFLRDEHEKECDVDIMIQCQLLPKLSNYATYKKLGLEFLQNLLSSEKSIVILDGLDEWSHPSREECMSKNKHLPHITARPRCTTLTTTRPWKLDELRDEPKEIDQKLELYGLDDDLLAKLTDRFAELITNVHRKDRIEKNEKFIQKMNDKNLKALSKIPVVVMQLLRLWYDDKPFGKSQSEIYTNMVDFLLARHFKKPYNDCEIETRNKEGCSSDQHISVCFQGSMNCKTHVDLLTKLGKLALDTLLGVNQESSHVFNVPIVRKYLSEGELNICLKVGIFTQEKVTVNISEMGSKVSCLHKTFQEFFTAVYVSKVSINEEKRMSIVETIKCACCSIEKILEMSQIYMFLSGFCPKVMLDLRQHLSDTVSADIRTKDYRDSCERGPMSSEGKTLMQVQDSMLDCLMECWLNEHNVITHLPVSDFFIGSMPGSQWSAELKSLTSHNHVCSLYVAGVDIKRQMINDDIVEDILNSVTVFDYIQKIWLWRVSETFVVNLFSQHKHSLIKNPSTWKHLKCITLEDVDMLGDILCTLVDSILQLRNKPLHVRLIACSIRPGKNDWKVILSHPNLIIDVNDVHDDSLTNVNSLQFHKK